jgi:hypothetical protein
VLIKNDSKNKTTFGSLKPGTVIRNYAGVLYMVTTEDCRPVRLSNGQMDDGFGAPDEVEVVHGHFVEFK